MNLKPPSHFHSFEGFRVGFRKAMPLIKAGHLARITTRDRSFVMLHDTQYQQLLKEANLAATFPVLAENLKAASEAYLQHRDQVTLQTLKAAVQAIEAQLGGLP